MSKLYFRFGTMNSSKSAQILLVKHNYEERGMKVLLLKPEIDNRDGENIVSSRIGLSSPCISLEKFINGFAEDEAGNRITKEKLLQYSAILVDECQFATSKEIDILGKIVDEFNIPVLCYGLRTDSNGHLFEGSKRLFEIADVFEQLKTVCWCGKAAIMNGRIQDGKIVKDKEVICIGGNERYVPLCREHYNSGEFKSII